MNGKSHHKRERGFTLISVLVSMFIVTVAVVMTSQVFSIYYLSRATIDKDQLLMDNDEAIAQIIFEKVKEYRDMRCDVSSTAGSYQVSNKYSKSFTSTPTNKVSPIRLINFGTLAVGIAQSSIRISNNAPKSHVDAVKRCKDIRVQSGDFHFCLLFLGDLKFKHIFPSDSFLRGISPFAEVSMRQYDYDRKTKVCRPMSEASNLEFLEGTITFFWETSEKKDLFYQRMFYFRSRE